MNLVSDFGWYDIMGQRVYNKLNAFDIAVRNGELPHWNFHEVEFNKHNWTVEPSLSLSELYQRRAQDIRNNYDYVILCYTGGADSQNIAEAFIHNNIRIDELFNRQVEESIDETLTNRRAENAHTEFTITTIPGYKKLKALQPDLKFTQWNYGKDIANSWQHAKVDVETINCIQPTSLIRNRVSDYCDIPASASSVALIYGTDKPRIIYENGQYWMLFFDDIFHQQSLSWLRQNNDRVTNDSFYWSPLSAQILIKQGHIIKNWFAQHPEFLWLLSTNCPDRTLYYSIINKLVYPGFTGKAWQTAKSKFFMRIEVEDWFYHDTSATYYQKWQSCITDYSDCVKDLVSRGLESKMVTVEGGLFRLPGCYSKFYCLGS